MKKTMICLAALVVAACVKETPSLLHEQGSSISFGASTQWLNDDPTRSQFFVGDGTDAPTRTEYSGKTENDVPVSSSGFSLERIDWSGGLDRIRIFCTAAGGGQELDGHADDYLIAGEEVNPENKGRSTATSLVPVNGNGLQWGTGDHYFYAVYPTEGSKSRYDAFGSDQSFKSSFKLRIEPVGNKARVYGVIPNWQNVAKVDNEFKPNMNYAYMTAAKKIAANATGNVQLDFKPLVTTFEFTLFQFSDDPSDDKLKKVELISGDGVPLANRRYSYDGTPETEYCTSYNAQANQYRIYTSAGATDLRAGFSAVINENNEIESVDYDPEFVTNTVKIEFPKAQTVQLGADPVKFTFLTLPLEHTDLTLKLTFASGQTRSLKLNQNGSPITVGACKKAYIYNIGVPVSAVYTLDNLTGQEYTRTGAYTTREDDTMSDGVLATAFKSYKTIGVGSHSFQLPVAYTVEFREATYDPDSDPHYNYTPWSTDCPTWVHGIAGGVFAGSIDGVDLDGVTVDDTAEMTVIAEPTTDQETGKTIWKITGSGDVHHNAMVALGTRGSTGSPYDLSTNGGAASRNTANCYIVDRPGVYSFPVVYGNSIKDGATNPSAYRTMIDGASDYCAVDGGDVYAFGPTSNSGAAPVYYLSNLTDHADRPITTPYVVDQNPGSLEAEVLWMDEPGLIGSASVSADGRTVTFTVPEDNITQGNAVIAVKGGGKILWSWHIWFYENSFTASQAGCPGFQFAPVPIGWCDVKTTYYPKRYCLVRITQNEGKGTVLRRSISITQNGFYTIYRGHATYFQGGRKDPFPGVLWNGYNQAQDKHLYALSGDEIASGSWKNGTEGGFGSGITLGTAIQNPFKWYAGLNASAVTGSWSKIQYANLWNTYLYNSGVVKAGYGEQIFFDQALVDTPRKAVKTVYDPSPAGYQVPSIRAFYQGGSDDFSESNFVKVENSGKYESALGTMEWDGRQYGSLFFPSYGTRHLEGTAAGLNGKGGHYWSCSPTHDAGFLSLSFGAGKDDDVDEHGDPLDNDYVWSPFTDDVHLFYFFAAPVMPVVESTVVR